MALKPGVIVNLLSSAVKSQSIIGLRAIRTTHFWSSRLLVVNRQVKLCQLRGMYETTVGPEGPLTAIDLRSDCVTRPTKEQRDAMASAVVGDVVFIEDPTVHKLERHCAELFGTEAALFVVSGSMGNMLCTFAHCSARRDVEIIAGREQHVFKYEQGSFSRFGGISVNVIDNQPDGSLCLDQVEAAIRNHTDVHMPKTELICIENTHNACGGTIIPLEYFKKLRALADKHKLKIHLDGARLWNASVATGIPMKEYIKYVDSVSCCFTKGVGAPIGSVIGGTRALIEEARRIRKAVGGGWRQAGVIAAAALVALETVPQRMARDHKNAKKIAEALNNIAGGVFHVPRTPDTNLIIVEVAKSIDPNDVVKMLNDKELGPQVLCFALSKHTLRLVTHSDLNDRAIDDAIEKFTIIGNIPAK